VQGNRVMPPVKLIVGIFDCECVEPPHFYFWPKIWYQQRVQRHRFHSRYLEQHLRDNDLVMYNSLRDLEYALKVIQGHQSWYQIKAHAPIHGHSILTISSYCSDS